MTDRPIYFVEDAEISHPSTLDSFTLTLTTKHPDLEHAWRQDFVMSRDQFVNLVALVAYVAKGADIEWPT